MFKTILEVMVEVFILMCIVLGTVYTIQDEYAHAAELFSVATLNVALQIRAKLDK